MYVKILAKQRSQIISDVLDTTLSHFPDETESHPFLAKVAEQIEAFFLTDHAESGPEAGDAHEEHILGSFMTPMRKHYHKSHPKIVAATPTAGTTTKTMSPDSPDSGIEDNEAPSPVDLTRKMSSPVIPYTRKKRRSVEIRDLDEKELKNIGNNASLLMDDDRGQTELVPSYEAPYSTVGSSLGSSWLGTFIDNNPFIFMGIFAAAAQALRYAGGMVVTVDFDVMLLIIFASFCLGLHTPRPMVGGVDKPPLKRGRKRDVRRAPTPTNAAKLLRQSMSPTAARSAGFGNDDIIMEGTDEEEEDEDEICITSPMPRFPEGAKLGSEYNCWSDPPCDTFNVRGDKYLSDRKKVKSGPFMFKSRGIDLFLTDDCPENVGR